MVTLVGFNPLSSLGASWLSPASPQPLDHRPQTQTQRPLEPPVEQQQEQEEEQEREERLQAQRHVLPPHTSLRACLSPSASPLIEDGLVSRDAASLHPTASVSQESAQVSPSPRTSPALDTLRLGEDAQSASLGLGSSFCLASPLLPPAARQLVLEQRSPEGRGAAEGAHSFASPSANAAAAAGLPPSEGAAGPGDAAAAGALGPANSWRRSVLTRRRAASQVLGSAACMLGSAVGLLAPSLASPSASASASASFSRGGCAPAPADAAQPQLAAAGFAPGSARAYARASAATAAAAQPWPAPAPQAEAEAEAGAEVQVGARFRLGARGRQRTEPCVSVSASASASAAPALQAQPSRGQRRTLAQLGLAQLRQQLGQLGLGPGPAAPTDAAAQPPAPALTVAGPSVGTLSAAAVTVRVTALPVPAAGAQAQAEAGPEAGAEAAPAPPPAWARPGLRSARLPAAGRSAVALQWQPGAQAWPVRLESGALGATPASGPLLLLLRRQPQAEPGEAEPLPGLALLPGWALAEALPLRPEPQPRLGAAQGPQGPGAQGPGAQWLAVHLQPGRHFFAFALPEQGSPQHGSPQHGFRLLASPLHPLCCAHCAGPLQPQPQPPPPQPQSPPAWEPQPQPAAGGCECGRGGGPQLHWAEVLGPEGETAEEAQAAEAEAEAEAEAAEGAAGQLRRQASEGGGFGQRPPCAEERAAMLCAQPPLLPPQLLCCRARLRLLAPGLRGAAEPGWAPPGLGPDPALGCGCGCGQGGGAHRSDLGHCSFARLPPARSGPPPGAARAAAAAASPAGGWAVAAAAALGQGLGGALVAEAAAALGWAHPAQPAHPSPPSSARSALQRPLQGRGSGSGCSEGGGGGGGGGALAPLGSCGLCLCTPVRWRGKRIELVLVKPGRAGPDASPTARLRIV